MKDCKEHFDGLAEDFEKNKAKHSFYYDAVNKTLKELIPNSEQKNILDIGCGIGDVIAYLNPKEGIGIDISENMIQYAKSKHKHIEFKVCDINNISDYQIKQKIKLDYILCIHIMEHLENLPQTFQNIKEISNKETQVIFLTTNPTYDFVLYIMEKLNLKMAEGNWNRMSIGKFKDVAVNNGFKIKEEGTRLWSVIKYLVLMKNDTEPER